MASDSKKATMWFIIGFLVLVTAGVIIAASMSSSSSSNANANFVSTTAPAITPADWKEGNVSSTVSVIEYGDFECPACYEYQPMVQQMLKDYGSKIVFIFRNFPLYSIHPDAGISAQAAEAAGLQGKYWQMHDLLYQDQSQWVATTPDKVVAQNFDGYASSLGLNVNKFNQDINSAVVAAKIQADVAGGNSAQIDHTPTFFINLKQIPNPNSYADLQSAINAALAQASSS